MASHLIGVDRRGGEGYHEVYCTICGNSLFIDNDSESGICAECVTMGYPKPKTEINIVEVKKALGNNSLRQYRKEKRLSQDTIAKFLGISRMHYWRVEEGKPIGKNIARKIEMKLAQTEKGQ